VQIPDFGSGLLDVAARTGIVYVFLVIALRLGGKHQVGQLSLFDFIVLLLVADAVQNSMVGENATLAGGLVAATTLVILDRVLDAIAGRSRRVRSVLEGEPRILIRSGVILERALQEESISRDELAAALRSSGVTDPADVAYAVLETDGSISVIRATPEGNPEPPAGID
jgi:uncharacterized membrane protein YcaP (DUF421 family)